MRNDFWKTAVFSAPAPPSRLGPPCRVQAALQLAARGASWQVDWPLGPVIGSPNVFLVGVFCLLLSK